MESEKKEFEKCYNLWLKKKELEHSKENLLDFCLFHNQEIDKHQKTFYSILKDKIKNGK